MDLNPPERFIYGLRALTVLILLAANLFYIAFSIHWTIIWDSAVMHYVNLLMAHGAKPYQDITDSNMPGAYLTEGWAMHIFGAGDIGWRVYDFFLSAVLTVAMVVIVRPYDWLAGVYAGGVFALLHGSEGPNFAVEREQVMTVLVVVAFALLFSAIRRAQPLLMLLFGFAAGVAATIKPTCAPLAVLLLLLAIPVLRKKRIPVAPYLLWALLGLSLAGLLVLGFLLRHDAIRPFLFVTRTLLPSYLSLRHLGIADLLRIMLPRNMLLLLPFAGILAVTDRSWNYERWFLLLGLAFGAFSYLAQQKGLIYHRYPFVAFLLLLMGLQFVLALRSSGWRRAVGIAGLLVTLIVSVPHYILTMRIAPASSPEALSQALQHDLEALDPAQLQGKVQCFDLTFGCFSALYHLDIVENTGFTGDLLLFSPTSGQAVDYYRAMFWRLAAKDPATVLVITNEWFQGDDSFRKIDTWPEFATYLKANYTVVGSRSFPIPNIRYTQGGADPPAYRIYIRNGSALLHKALTHSPDPLSP